MRKYGILLLLMAAASCWAQKDSLQNRLTFGLDMKIHGETCGGGLPKAPDGSVSADDRSHFLLGQFRINADYERPGLQVHATLQNKAVWGTKDNAAMKLYEGWAKVTAKCGLFAQAGRVALSYDDERIIGLNDFAMAALSHDVLRVGYEGHGHKAHAILAYNQNVENVYWSTYYVDGAQGYKTMHTLWYHYDVPSFPLGVSALFMNVGMQAGKYHEVKGQTVPDPYDSPRTEYQQMFGGYLNFHPEWMTFEASYYRQTGKSVDRFCEAAPIRAWMASVKASVKPFERLGFKAGYDHLSGDDYVPLVYGGKLGMVRHDVLRGFTPLYGSRSTFYGILDFFYESAFIHGFTPGLQDASFGVFGTPVNKLDCGVTYHYMSVGVDLEDLPRTLGHSVELQASYAFSKDISLALGYTLMFGTETMQRLKQDEGDKHAHWGWFSLNISPTLFTTKW